MPYFTMRFKNGILSVARVYDLTKPSSSETKRCPIVDILSLISVEIALNLLSKVRLLSKYCDSAAASPHKPSLSFCVVW